MQITFFFHLVVYFIQDIKECSVVCVLELGKFDENNLEEGLCFGRRVFIQSERGRFSQSHWSLFC